MKKITLLILLAFSYTAIYAQIDFEEHIVIDETNVANGPQQVLSVDLDNDGFKDVLFSAGSCHKIGWFKNIDGQGNFSDLKNIDNSNLEGIYRVFPVDMDNDGDIDIVASYKRNENHKIIWFKNTNGEGAFSDEILITENKFDFVKVKDIDGDGDIDIVYSLKSEKRISWYENIDGQGNTFEEQILFNDTHQLRLLDLEDIDNDGDIDIIFDNNSTGVIRWLENNTGNFTVVKEASINNTPNQLADIDNDGDFDLITTKYIGDHKIDIIWFENVDGLGDFTNPKVIIEDVLWLTSIKVDDVNNDGANDVLFTTMGTSGYGYDDCYIAWLKNIDGLGNFGTQQNISTINLWPISIAVTDIDNDGKQDVLTASILDDKIGWFKNINGQGNFDSQHIITTSADGVHFVSGGDLNGNGNIDILSCNGYSEKTCWYENTDGLGNFGIQQTVPFSSFASLEVFSVDIDNDGDNDMLTRLYSNVVWYENTDGLGSFTQKHIVVNNINHSEVMHYGDIDNDGDIDVIYGSKGNYQLAWYENTDGLGTYGAEHILFSSQVMANSVELIDIDNDGDLDVLTGTFDFKRISWYENLDGLGNYSERRLITYQTMKPNYVNTVDLDQDGDTDILCMDWNWHRIVWFENEDGLGNFSDRQILINDVEDIRRIKMVDIDGDNDMDILATSLGTNKLVWFENTDGMGAFATEQSINTNLSSVYNFFSIDIDTDGDNDILVASPSDNTIAWYENKGPLGVHESPITGFSIYPNPTATILNIDANKDISKIEIFDQLGKRMLVNSNKKQIDVSQLDAGIYFVKVKDFKGAIMTSKLIKN